MMRIPGLILILLTFSTAAIADISVPEPKKATPAPTAAATDEAQMYISLTAGVNEPELVFTKKMIAKLNAALEAKNGTPAPVSGYFDGASTTTMVGGVFLSLSIVFGGLWLARSKTAIPKPALGVAVLAVFGMAATIVIANAPPPRRVALTYAIFDEKALDRGLASGKVKISIVDYDSRDDIGLLLPNKNAVTSTGKQ